jgi:DNA mismatch endonuclease Vsr
MSRIRKYDSVPEMTLRKALWRCGLRGWRLYRQDIPGNPDVAFVSHRLAVFVDGCFWHKCPSCFRRPHTRLRYWDAKIEGNVARDMTQGARLRRQGWRVLRFWEHEVLCNPARCAAEVGRMLQ